MPRISVCILAVLVCVTSAASGLKPASDAPASWESTWASVGVDPAPPKDFLKVHYTGRIDNLTDGRISNETARKWVLADLRRGQGDNYAAMNLREDIANAGIFGPMGLNGTGRGIKSLREKGVERIEGPTDPNIVAAAVIAVPKELQAAEPDSGLTDYVIVLLFRAMPSTATVVYRDGRREVEEGKTDGKLSWQLDTGHFFEHPMFGPLWYQQNGWSCRPDDTVVGKLCARVKP